MNAWVSKNITLPVVAGKAVVIGDVIRPIGVSSQSLSIDGLSQSLSTTLNAQGNLLNPRVKQYYEELFRPQMPEYGEINILKEVHRGIIFDTL